MISPVSADLGLAARSRSWIVVSIVAFIFGISVCFNSNLFAQEKDFRVNHRTRILARISNHADAQKLSSTLKTLGLTEQQRYRAARLVKIDAVPDAVTPLNNHRPTEQISDIISQLRRSELFDYVEPDFTVHASALPNDAQFVDGTLWALQNYGQLGGAAGADIAVTNAWSITTGSTNIVVAVIDTGIRYTHRDLAAQMWRNATEVPGNGIDDDGDAIVDDVFGVNAIAGSGDPMDDNDHGTHVAGTIAAAANDGNPHVGVAWNVRLMACKCLDAYGNGYMSDAITCIDYAVTHGAKILNASWAGSAYSQALRDTIVSAQQHGVLFVAAAGNYAQNSDYIATYPAGYQIENVISVAAIDRFDQLANFSNYGMIGVNLGAPGVDIFSCAHGSDTDYKTFSGTSMACPHVSGVAALLASRIPNISVTELRQRLLTTVTRTPALNQKTSSGGRVNAYAALTASPSGVPTIEVRPNTLLPLIVGRPVDLSVSVADLTAITNATVTAAVAGYTNVVFRNDGSSPDLFANDSVYAASFTVPNVNPLTINVSVSAPGKSTLSKTVTFPSQAPPANDRFANRITISGASNIVSGSNIGATTETSEPNHFNGQAVGKSVWWSWTAPADMNVVVNTFYSMYDTVLAVYTGTNVSQLTLVGSNDYNASGGVGKGDSLVSFFAKAGTQYRIAVDGNSKYITSDQGAIQLNLNGPPVFTLHPRAQVASTGLSVSLQASAVGTPPLSYQWTKNGAAISGATNTVLNFDSVSVADSGNYCLKVATQYGSATSATAGLTVSTSTSISAPQGLVAWWPAQSNAIDLITKTSGVVSNITYLPGEVGQAFRFDGTASMITCPSNINWNVGVGPGFTVEGWINPRSIAQNQTIFEWKGVLFFSGVSLRISEEAGPGCLLGYLTRADETIRHTVVSAANLLTTNQFQHVALTYDKVSGDAKLYLNATVVARRVLTNLTLSTPSDVRLGASFRPNDSHSFDGVIDELSVYNRALSDNEIGGIWLAGGSGKVGAPTITLHPSSQTVFGSQPIQLITSSSGAAPLNFKWQKNGNLIPGATNSLYSLTYPQPDDSGTYSVVVSNMLGTVTSSNADLLVAIPPTVLTQPMNQAATLMSNATFLIGSSGSSPMFFQWNANGARLTDNSHIVGTRSAALSIVGVSRQDSASYTCVVSNAYGVITTSNAFLSVMVPQRAQLVNNGYGKLILQFQDFDGFPATANELGNVQLQVSSDLFNWMDLTNSVFLSNGFFNVVDSRTNAAQQFYRVKSF